VAINIFEGARRIALLLGGGAALITVLVAFNQDAYYRAQYSLAAPNAPFRKTDGGCPSEGRTIYFDHKTSSGKEVSVSVCLEPMTFTNKNKEEVELIPYKSDADGMTWGARPYSTEISTYETQVKKRFTMTATDEEVSIKEAAKQWRSQFAEAMGYLVAGLAIFGALVWATGWIVRGFLGIPRGMDKRPDL
jgi:hypothetical protein